jgi:glucokinase
MMNTRALGIDIGGTKIAAALVAPDGTIGEPHRVPTPVRAGPSTILQAAVAAGREVLKSAGPEHVVAVGVGSAGHVDHERGVITYAADTLPGWTGTDLAGAFRDAFDLPVSVDNDVNAMALGERRFGAGRSFDTALYLTIGTGVGGALVQEGSLWRGTTWTAGEIGHLLVAWDGRRRCSCGHTGHLEAYCAGPAIAKRYSERLNLAAPLDLRDVAARAEAGDDIAREAIAEGATILGLALSGLLSVLDPAAVIVGGGVAELGQLWWEPLETALRDAPMPGPARVALHRAELGVHAVLIGAGWMALEQHAGSLLASRS